MPDFLQNMNGDQLAAVQASGNILVVASPGSGKTRTLIHKIALELSKIESHREFVVALTYTHVAAEEIRDRIDSLGVDTDQLWVGTIHSFCLEWILRPYGIYHPELASGFKVIDILESEEILDEIAKRNGISAGHYDCKYYATADGYLLDRHVSPKLREPLIKTIREYHSRLLVNQQIDFEMMLRFSHDLLSQHRPIAPRLNQLFRLIAIDEYQDTKDVQYRIVGKVLNVPEKRSRLFIVGDPNQAIFSSLGGVAMPRAQLQDLIGSPLGEYALTKNYRSSQQIIDYFSHFAVHPMQIEAAGALSAFVGNVVHDTSINKQNLVESLANLIQYNVQVLGIKPEEICIVAPWWIHLASVTRALVQRLPEYEFNGPGLSPFGQNLDNFWYKVARIALTQAAPNMYRKRMRWAKEIVEYLDQSGHLGSGWDARELLRVANGIHIDTEKGSEFLRQYFTRLLEDLHIELRSETEIQSHWNSFFERMEKRLTEILTRESMDVDDLTTFRRVFRPRTGIVLSTIHGVKGMEFDTIIAYGLLEEILPHFNEPQSEKRNVANRLLFVVGSRARQHLFLVSEQGRGQSWSPKVQSNVLRELRYEYTSESISIAGL